MGYYSKFSLRVDPPELRDQVDRALTTLAYNDGTTSVFAAEHWNGGNGCKWYTYDDDCQTLSKRMPNVRIEVERLGEDDGDHWRYTYLNGDEISSVQLPMPRHTNAQGHHVELREIDDAYLRNIARRADRECRAARRKLKALPVSAKLQLMAWEQSLAASLNECRRRSILPTVDDLRVAWDRACDRGFVDPKTSTPRCVLHVGEGPVRDGEDRPTWSEPGPWDLVELWVGFGDA